MWFFMTPKFIGGSCEVLEAVIANLNLFMKIMQVVYLAYMSN